jgi:peroxiredoxin/predicted 2-oxoglutarate/Fe(II)-dependent dioxygenase YbiX
MLIPGDPFPAISVRTQSRANFPLDSLAARYVVISFIAGSAFDGTPEFLKALYRSGKLFNDDKVCCLVVSTDPTDVANPILVDRMPGIRVVWDHDHALARAFDIIDDSVSDKVALRLFTYILDPGQRVLEAIAVQDIPTHFEAVKAAVKRLPDPRNHVSGNAPVLIVPNLLEPQLCADFIAYAERHGLEDSGYAGTDPTTARSIGVVDHGHECRLDCMVEDETLRSALQARVVRRLAPQIERAYQFKLTRMERYRIACYNSNGGGGLGPHRENTTLGTAHRKFALSISLNDEYAGGGLRFPEFGRKVYNAPAGAAVVFSCSLLHQAMPVTTGRHYCLLPFVYDEAAAQVRLENTRHLEIV